MYGVPPDLPLHVFVGQELNQICLGCHDLQFHFDTGHISVQGAWELRNPAAGVVDRSTEPADRASYRLHVLLGIAVVRFLIDVPKSFTLEFASGHTLTVFDDSPQHEAFSVCCDGRTVYV